jgi:hypothetical protein
MKALLCWLATSIKVDLAGVVEGHHGPSSTRLREVRAGSGVGQPLDVCGIVHVAPSMSRPLRAASGGLRPAWTASSRRDQRPGRGDGGGAGVNQQCQVAGTVREQVLHVALDVVWDGTDLGRCFTGGVGKVPVEVTLPG